MTQAHFTSIQEIQKKLKRLGNRKKAKILQRFFKTGPGEYGEGDIFVGITVPELRKVSKQCQLLGLKETLCLLKSPIHEERLLSLFILILKYSKSVEKQKKEIYQAYLQNTKYINNWDLIDLSAERIIGNFLINKDKKILCVLAKSKNLWKRRIAIMSTFQFIKNNKLDDTLRIAKILLPDKEDLIQKAVGWMLREIGKRDIAVEEKFLKQYYKTMPRTMLRYAIERFPEAKRQAYLKERI